ncbi:T9SS sorting signal type C domain-containing protein [Flavobacterium sp.]
MNIFTRLNLTTNPMQKIASGLVILAFLFTGPLAFSQNNSYLGLNGGFEGAATIVNGTTNSSPVATNWTKSTTTAAIASETSVVRSGSKSMKVSSTSTTLCRVFSPSMTISSSTTAWQVQYYRRSPSNTATVQNQTGNYRGGTEQSNGSYTSVSAANTWEKVTYSPSSTTAVTSAAAHMLVRATGGGGDTFYDDFVLYESASIDNTAPNVPGSVTFSGQTNSSIGLSWTAASGGTDGGGYIVVRGTTDPTTAPNVNGIYATTNTIGTGTVVYQGTGTSFTDTGLSAGTTYFYRVYTYDKAYNYSVATTGNSTTSSGLAIDGIINAGEYGIHTNGSNQDTNTITWYNTWDNTNLYIGIGATSNNTTEGAIVYIDVNPIVPVNGGTNTNGTNVGFAYDRGTINPAFRADYVLYFKSGYYEIRPANGSGGWGTAVTTGLTYAQSGAGATQSQEISIPWSVLGGLPASYNWSAYKVYDGGASNNGVYGQVPANNPGGAQNQTAYTLNSNRYYTVSSTTSGSSTLPFSRTSYCQPIGVTSNGFGAISVYDFTVNPGSGFQVARSANTGGDWTIAGNLVVGSGVLYFGSGGSTYGASTVANVNITGGALNLDQTSVALNVSGNVTIGSGGTLALSGTSGGDINLGGNWNNSGTFTPNNRAVGFNGASAQTLTGATTFDFMTLNGAGGLTLSNSITVNRTLTLTNGKITLGSNNLTVSASPATISGGSSSSYIVTNGTGTLTRNSVGNTATTFPVGLTASYTPLTVTNTGTVNNLSLAVASPPTNAVTDATRIVNLEWNLSSAGAGTVGTIAFNWNTGNQGASYTASGQGELGNYTSGPTYAITNIGTMAGQTKTVTGVALSSGSNKLVIGNTGAVYAMPPANDNCAGATAVTLDAAAVTGNVTNATQSISSVLCNGFTGTANDDVWYSFTTGAAGTYTITVVGSASFDAVVDFRSGACNGTNVSCADSTTAGGTETIIASGLTAATTYYVRVYDYGTGVPATTTFTIAVTSPPASLSTNGTTTLSFGNVAPLTSSIAQNFNLSGSNLTGAPGNITVTAPNTDFQVSNDNTTWGATTTVAYTSSTLSATAVYVRFTPQSSGAKSGNITFSGGGTSGNPTIALSGTGVLPAPVATDATNIAATSFDANWNAVTGASSGYLLDVSTSSTFGTTGVVINEGFESVTFPPTGWITTGWARSTTTGDFLNGVAAAVGNSNNGTLTTSVIANPTSMTFYLGRSGNPTVKTLTVEVSTTSQTTGFTTVATYDHSNVTASTYNQYTVDLSAYSSSSTVYIRFNKTSTTTSPWRLDDVVVNGNVPSFVTGYNAKPISGQATVTSSVTGLVADTTYYYRLRATDGTPSGYSNVITVRPASRGGSVTADQTICSGTQPATLTLSGNNGTVVKWQKSSDAAFTNPTDINVTTTTLTGSDVGALTATTYIRAVVQSFTNPTANSAYATITVTQSPTFANLQYPASGTICESNTFDAFGQVYQAGITEAAGAGTGISAEFGYNTSDTDPSTWTNWVTATFNVQSGNNDEFKYTFTPPSSGVFYYTFRYRQGSCGWVYGGYNGGFWNGSTNVNGMLTVNAASTAAVISGGGNICSGATSNLQVAITGGASPYSVVYTDGTSNFTVNGYTSATNIPVSPSATTTYTIVSVTSANTCIGTGNSGSATVTLTTTTSTDGGATWNNGTPSANTSLVFDGGSGTITSNLLGCSLSLVNNASVVIASGNNVTLTGAVSVQSGSTLTLNNNANLLQGGTTNNNSGNIIVKRNSAAIKRLDYTLWSSPVSGQALYAFSPFTFANRFYVYDSANDIYTGAGLNVTGTNTDGVNGVDQNNVPFAAATGYLIRVPWNHPTAPTTWTGTFTGIPNNGTITRTGLTNGSYYAIGNPYPSTIDADQFIIDNAIGDDPLTPGDGLYFWRKTNNANAASYATYTTAGGVESGGDTLEIVPNGVIQVGQGFIVKATSTSLQFNNNQRIGNNDNQFLRNANTIERNRIWLNLSNGSAVINQMMVSYMTGATQGIDPAIDGRYFNDNPTALTSLLNNEEFVIQGRSLPFTASDVVPLAFKSDASGSFTIAIDHVDGLFAGGAQAIYLKDNLTATEHNLQTGAYNFSSEAGTFNSRFEIIFQPQLSIENPSFTANSVIVYSQANGFVINSGNTVMSSIKVFDIRGRLLQQRNDINSNQTTITAGTANEVLLIQITSEDGLTVTKKVIR